MPTESFWAIYKLYFQWSIDVLFISPNPLVTLALTVNLLASSFYSWRVQREKWLPRFRWVFTQFLFFPVLVAAGVLGRNLAAYDPVTGTQPTVLAYFIVYGLILVSLCFGLYWVYRLKGYRWLAIGIMLFQLWLMHAAGWIAGMAITGDWI